MTTDAAMLLAILAMLATGQHDLLHDIGVYARTYDLPLERAYRQIYVESGFKVDAVSPDGSCIGLGQLNKNFWAWVGDLTDPDTNLNTAFAFMHSLLKRYNGNYEKALAAYNWGPGNLDRCIEKYGDSWFHHIPAETRRYIEKVVTGK